MTRAVSWGLQDIMLVSYQPTKGRKLLRTTGRLQIAGYMGLNVV